ncbi:hypothetical protein LTR85_003432 [Meristemomyces frigidus]|nr:hypothetical protein LTR85_003432 [Meristemomyces frigidus]
MICPIVACGSSFCYICGEFATGHSNHWAVGKPCPRYNQPGGEEALYDEDDEDAEEEDFVDDLLLVDWQESDNIAHRAWNDDGQPLLIAPPAGQNWFDRSEQDLGNEVNSKTFAEQMGKQVNHSVDEIDEIQTQYPWDLGNLSDLLEQQLDLQFCLHRIRRQESNHVAARVLMRELRGYEEANDEINILLGRFSPSQILQRPPMLAQALDFYTTHKDAVVRDITAKIDAFMAEPAE